MNDNTLQNMKLHNVVMIIITIASIGVIIESITMKWEYWVPLLITIGLISSWIMHITNYRDFRFRENFFLVYSMVIAFYHGIHETSYFDVVVISSLLLVTATLLKRKEFLFLFVIEFFLIILMHTIWACLKQTVQFDSLTISRVMLHSIAILCLYYLLTEILKHNKNVEDELKLRQQFEEEEKNGMEDFLVNISHELRTPVNVIGGMATLILKNEQREDVSIIMDADIRLAHQIEDIQDYSEIQRNEVTVEEDKYMFSSLINDIVLNSSWLKKKNIELVIDVDSNIPTMLKGDSKKISKTIMHLLDNAFKFTKKGGVYLRITGAQRRRGVNLNIEVRDTGVGISKADLEKISGGGYHGNKKRNRSTGGIGLGLSIVYGFVRKMNGFVSIESAKTKGTVVRISLAQEVLDASPYLSVEKKKELNIIFHVNLEKYKVTAVREFYNSMATNMASGLKLNLYSAPNVKELKKIMEKGNITHIFMGSEEYIGNADYFDELAREGIVVTVYAEAGFAVNKGSNVIVVAKPIYGYQIAKILNGMTKREDLIPGDIENSLILDGKKALIVDDEPMNLVIEAELFKGYKMIIDTAGSGREAVKKYESGDYDIIFMDHMMPEMDGVETMRQIRSEASHRKTNVKIIALTANAISGAREMFLEYGFDDFISKPIYVKDFERAMNRVFAKDR